MPKKDKNQLKGKRQYRHNVWYVYNTKLSRIERCNPIFNGRNRITMMPSIDIRVQSRIGIISNLLLWKKENPYKILLYNLGDICTNSCIDPIIFINDILPIFEGKQLDIISIDFNWNFRSNGEFTLSRVIFKEKGFQKGDGLPADMIEYYVSYLKSSINSLRKKYFSEYTLSDRDKLYSSYKDVAKIDELGTVEFKIEMGIAANTV